MKSEDKQISLTIIDPPYYKGTFTEVPMNPFSISLFGYLGIISKDIYDEYLDIFSDNVDKNISLYKKFIPEFVWNRLDYANKITEIVNLVKAKDADYNNSFKLLSYFFKLNVIYYSEDIHTKVFEQKYNNVYGKDINIYIDCKNKIYPILIQEIDGVIKNWSIVF